MTQQTSRASHGMSVRVFWGDFCIHSEFVPPSRRAPYCVGRLPACDLELPLPRSYAPLQPLIQWEKDEPFFQPRTQLGAFEIVVTPSQAPRAVRSTGPIDYRFGNTLVRPLPPLRGKTEEVRSAPPPEARALSNVRHVLQGSSLLGAGLGKELEVALQGLRNANASSFSGPGAGSGLRGDNRGGRLGVGFTIGDLGLTAKRQVQCDTPDCGALLRKGKGPAIDAPLNEPPRFICSAPGTGCLDKELIRESIRKAKSAIRACYEYALTTRPNLAGKLTVRFTFGADGVVRGAEAAESSLDDALMTQCVLNRIRGIAFPRSAAAAQYTIHYPFLFRQ
ncbi:MAG: AgmX/PglI C-terminal domain-containing protein [Myxococcaceae bacterium]|nr:AgmX/PglI C-terminal domain-containing protein [Myxococcaceae bacterium]